MIRALSIPILLLIFHSGATELGKDSTRFTIDGRPTFLLGMSYYAGLGASDEFVAKDLEDMRRDGFNWIRVWATWAAFTNNIAAVEANGAPREPFLSRLEKLIRECDRRGMIVDVTLSRESGKSVGPRLQRLEEHERAVRTLVERLHPLRNWYLDLGNERNVRDSRFVSYEDLRRLREVVREIDAKRLVTASHSSDDGDFAKAIERYVRDVRVDFVSEHRSRMPGTTTNTAAATNLYLEKMKTIGVVVPIQYDEPFRRGYTKGWEPGAEDFMTDLHAAIESGAAGWCFHNGAEVGPKDGRSRRSFDLREKRLYEQLDPVEMDVVRRMRAEFGRNGK